MTIKHLNKKNNYLFKKRLTDWMSLKEIPDYSSLFYQYHGRKAYGRHFIIKKRGRRKQYALYVREENEMQREEDKDILKEAKELTFEKFVYPYKALLSKVKKRYIS